LTETQALFWKEKGNLSFKEGKIEEAINYYSRGIEMNDTESVLFSNRAKCFKQLGRLEEGLRDIQMAIDLDDSNIKAYLIQGQLLAEQGKLESNNDKIELAIAKMTKALRLCTTLDKPSFKEDITKYLLRARKLLWYKAY